MFKISKHIEDMSQKALDMCKEQFKTIDEITEHNQRKMLKAFIDCGVSESHLIGSTGYGYGDRGRDTLDKIYAKVFDAEDALVRHNFVCGTHAIAVGFIWRVAPGRYHDFSHRHTVRHFKRRYRS